MAGRPRKFDEATALKKAVNLFWEQGYEATSTQQLKEVMGIGQQSLYNTFGDKRQLFLRAIEDYRSRMIEPVVQKMEGDEASILEIRAYFSMLVRTLGGKAGRRACLLVNSVVELGGQDEVISKVGHAHVARFERAFLNCINNAIRRGELETDKSPRAIARHLTTTSHGLIVLAKAGVGKRALWESAEMALSVLDLE